MKKFLDCKKLKEELNTLAINTAKIFLNGNQYSLDDLNIKSKFIKIRKISNFKR